MPRALKGVLFLAIGCIIAFGIVAGHSTELLYLAKLLLYVALGLLLWYRRERVSSASAAPREGPAAKENARPSDVLRVKSQHASNCEQRRRQFEGSEAIYIEKGALRVRVSNIRPRVTARSISADVEEIPTPGLRLPGLRLLSLAEYQQQERERPPRRWKIGAGYETRFSDHFWNMGYGGWSLHFAPSRVQGVVSLASRFPENMDPYEGYCEVLRFLKDQEAYEPADLVFPEA